MNGWWKVHNNHQRMDQRSPFPNMVLLTNSFSNIHILLIPAPPKISYYRRCSQRKGTTNPSEMNTKLYILLVILNCCLGWTFAEGKLTY